MDLTCPICLNVYFKPVKLPCNHILCQECLERSLDISTLECPICRHRLSVWKRRLKDVSLCIDKARDTEIGRLFPRYYSDRAEGLNVSLCDSEASVLREVTGQVRLRLASPGAIKSEFDEAISRINKSSVAEEGFREEASLALSRHILLETSVGNDSVDSHPQINADEMLALEVAQQDRLVHRASKPPKNRKVRSTLACRPNLRSGRVLRDRYKQTSLLRFSKKI
ncbi:E3 ubiquitin-protein ligase [Echinococcus granulosus]|uniref:RING-type E3 ubiquitin transferase n=1 Tax=Echinococcus granulosus TaxID=6210 RepID=W6V9I6_ECHGR|nr:E3 ubiquitin-protein ligase [Echinococcus granulosus]EUB63294.1 E3 ubiquitin-protein ligase [Echinococcus granulosus]